MFYAASIYLFNERPHSIPKKKNYHSNQVNAEHVLVIKQMPPVQIKAMKAIMHAFIIE